MLPDDTRGKIKDITTGTFVKWEQDNCTAIRNLLCASFPTSTTVKEGFESNAIRKEEQAKLIGDYISENGLWVKGPPSKDRYLTRGGEAKVYLQTDGRLVIKLNDALYCVTGGQNTMPNFNYPSASVSGEGLVQALEYVLDFL